MSEYVALVKSIICYCSPPYGTPNALTSCKVCQTRKKDIMVKISVMNEGVMFAISVKWYIIVDTVQSSSIVCDGSNVMLD